MNILKFLLKIGVHLINGSIDLNPKPKENLPTPKNENTWSAPPVIASQETIQAVKFKNDSQRLKTEYNQLKQINKPLYDLLNDVTQYVFNSLKKDVIVTMIFRTQEEQADIYKNDPKYKAKPFKSPHQFWNSIDIRSFIYTSAEIDQISGYLNSKYNPDNQLSFTALNHKVTDGAEHFHLQLLKK